MGFGDGVSYPPNYHSLFGQNIPVKIVSEKYGGGLRGEYSGMGNKQRRRESYSGNDFESQERSSDYSAERSSAPECSAYDSAQKWLNEWTEKNRETEKQYYTKIDRIEKKEKLEREKIKLESEREKDRDKGKEKENGKDKNKADLGPDLGPNSGIKSSRNRGPGTDSRFTFDRTQSERSTTQKNKNMESDPSSSSRKNSESDPSSSSGKKKVEKNLDKNVESDPRSDPRSNEHSQDGNNKNGNIRNDNFDKKNDHVDYLRGLRVSKLIIELPCMSINDLRRLMSIR